MIAIYPGSFDPLTLGHEDIIKRAALFFDRLIVAVGVNDSKQYMIDTEDRVKLIKLACKSIKNLDVISYHGLTVQLAKEKKLILLFDQSEIQLILITNLNKQT